MNSRPGKPHTPFWLAATAAIAVGLVAGCNTVFTPKHRVLVDTICAPGLAVKLSETSYRLLAKRSTVANPQAQVDVIKACVDSALMGKGMYEAPPNAAPDVFIELAYGVDTTPRVDASMRETFLQLSARSNPTKAFDRGTGAEIWDVRVAVLGIAGRMETAMPLLAAVASDYIGTDTKLEMRIEIPKNAASVRAVREGAIQALERKAPAAANPAAAKAAVEPVTTK
jgi:hypothetical protein